MPFPVSFGCLHMDFACLLVPVTRAALNHLFGCTSEEYAPHQDRTCAADCPPDDIKLWALLRQGIGVEIVRCARSARSAHGDMWSNGQTQ